MIDYVNHWSLRRRPFSMADDRAFFAGMPQREAIAGLNYFASNRLGSALLVAPRRCGTTSLLSHVKRMRGFGDCASEVLLTKGNQSFRAEVQSELGRALGFCDVSGDVAGRIRRAIDANRSQGVQIIWLIDGGHSAAALLARRLVRTAVGLSVVLATTGDQWERRAEQFGRGCMRIDLTPLSVADTIDYIGFCLVHAGAREPIFQDSAAVRVQEFAGGRIADVAVVAESSLMLAARHGLDDVTPAIVEATMQQMMRAA